MELAWCDDCGHTHRKGGECLTECIDCEEDLVRDVEDYLKGETNAEPE